MDISRELVKIARVISGAAMKQPNFHAMNRGSQSLVRAVLNRDNARDFVQKNLNIKKKLDGLRWRDVDKTAMRLYTELFKDYYDKFIGKYNTDNPDGKSFVETFFGGANPKEIAEYYTGMYRWGRMTRGKGIYRNMAENAAEDLLDEVGLTGRRYKIVDKTEIDDDASFSVTFNFKLKKEDLDRLNTDLDSMLSRFKINHSSGPGGNYEHGNAHVEREYPDGWIIQVYNTSGLDI